MDDRSLVDLIYEAAALPSLWPNVLDRLGQIAACDKAVFFAIDGTNVGRWAGNEAGSALMEVFVRDRWMERNTQGARTMAGREPKFIHDLDIFTRQEIDADPFYQGFLRPNAAAWGTGTYITGATDNRILVSIHRDHAQGPIEQERVDRLTALRPDLARAAFLSARLRLEEARASLAALEAVGLPAAALGESGVLKLASSSFEALIPDLFIDTRERIRLVDTGADQRLEKALAEMCRRRQQGASFATRGGHQTSSHLLHLLPIQGAAHDVFSGLFSILIAVPVQGAPSVDPGLLQGLFDLTPAEARIAKEIIGGKSLEAAAIAYGVSRETARTQLKSVLVKTGTHRQSEFVALLAPAFSKVQRS